MLFGRVAIPWNLVATALDYWKDNPDLVPRSCRAYQYAVELDRFRTHFTSTHQTPIRLFEAIQWSQHAKATDPRDKVYALRGLTSDGPRLVPIPNYKQTLAQVLRDLTRAMIIQEKSLHITCIKGLNPCEYERPLWEPSWLYLWFGMKTALDIPTYSQKTSISRVPVHQDLTKGILQTQGIILGSICEISSFIEYCAYIAPAECGGPDRNCDTSSLSRNLHRHYPSGIATAVLQCLSLGLAPNNIDFQFCLSNFWQPKARETVIGRKRSWQWDRINDWLQQNASFKIGASTLQELSL